MGIIKLNVRFNIELKNRSIKNTIMEIK